MNELIKVTQLPIIEEQLLAVKEKVEERVAKAESLLCTEETRQSVKKIRADLNKERQEGERQYREAKEAVLAPVRRVDATFKDCFTDVYARADAVLKKKIADVEDGMKLRCEDALREFYSELCVANHIDFVPFERTGIVVSMTDATAKTQPPKKLREQLEQFIAGIGRDVDLISTMDSADEIMTEYKQNLDATRAIMIIQDRHRRIEEETAARAAREEAKAREAEAVKRVESFAPPVVAPAAPAAPKEVSLTFTVTDTVERLKILKQFLVSNGYKFK